MASILLLPLRKEMTKPKLSAFVFSRLLLTLTVRKQTNIVKFTKPFLRIFMLHGFSETCAKHPAHFLSKKQGK